VFKIGERRIGNTGTQRNQIGQQPQNDSEYHNHGLMMPHRLYAGIACPDRINADHRDLGSVERFEINEAFAATAIVVARELSLPDEIVNVEGGAVAHGHPIGATGAILTTRLIHSMRRDRLTRGVVTMCIGGGQGIAMALEILS
jgi:acetyl-CoA acetyltransferase